MEKKSLDFAGMTLISGTSDWSVLYGADGKLVHQGHDDNVADWILARIPGLTVEYDDHDGFHDTGGRYALGTLSEVRANQARIEVAIAEADDMERRAAELLSLAEEKRKEVHEGGS